MYMYRCSRYRGCYKIWPSGGYDFLIISPDIAAALITEMQSAHAKEKSVCEDEIFPPGYTEYLEQVMDVNRMDKSIYDVAAEQFRRLKVEQSLCFEEVKVSQNQEVWFDLKAGNTFYMLIRNARSRFRYVFPDEEGKEISVPLEQLYIY